MAFWRAIDRPTGIDGSWRGGPRVDPWPGTQMRITPQPSLPSMVNLAWAGAKRRGERTCSPE